MRSVFHPLWPDRILDQSRQE